MSAPPDDTSDPACNDAFARFERAERADAKCATRVTAAREELHRLTQRKIEIYTMNKINAGQRAAWFPNLIEKTVIPYSKAWNRIFAGKIHATLPPEVRDMIYGYLLDDDMWDEYQYTLQAVMSAVTPDVGHCRCLTHAHGLPRVPHYLFEEYMESEASREVVAKLYQSVWFKGQTVYGIAVELQNLLHKDIFGAGFDPISCITGLSILCPVDNHRRPRVRKCSNESCQHTPYERHYIEREELRSDFDQLTGVLANKDFRCLEVTFMQRNVRIDVLEEALKAFKPIYHAFKKAGVEMCICWEYSVPDCKSENHDHSRYLAKFFSDSRFAWKHRMYQFLRQMKPCIQTRHIRFEDEPSLGLLDAEFVHRMWESEEESLLSDDEDTDSNDCQDNDSDCDDGERSPEFEHSSDRAARPMSTYFKVLSREL